MIDDDYIKKLLKGKDNFLLSKANILDLLGY